MPRVRRGALDAAVLFAPLLEHKAIGLAVSGGADSLALMLLAHRWIAAEPSAPKIFIYTVNHGLRPEAAKEVTFVMREAARLKFSARALRWDGEKPKTGLQEAARIARYRLFAGAMQDDGAEVLVTAHHQGDQAETVLMRLAHGSGIEGLRGMDYFAEIGALKIVRPLLRVDPVELRKVVDEAGLNPVTDPSNSDLDFERVRWRQMLPGLDALGLTAGRLSQFAERMRDADRALENLTSRAFAEAAVSDPLRTILIERALLMSVPRAVAIRVVGRALARVGDGRKPHALGAVETLTDRLIREKPSTTLSGCLIRSDGETIRFEPEPPKGARAKARKIAEA